MTSAWRRARSCAAALKARADAMAMPDGLHDAAAGRWRQREAPDVVTAPSPAMD